MTYTRAAETMNHPTILNMVRAARMAMSNATVLLISRPPGSRTESGVAVTTMAARSEMATLPISIEVWRQCLTVLTRRQVRRRVARQNLSVLAVAAAAALAAAGRPSRILPIAVLSCAAVMNQASNTDGGRLTPASSIAWKNGG